MPALLIETDDLDSAGLPALEELSAAISEFRRSGKKVIAHGSYFLEGQYYLAAQADEVYLDPLGFVLLPGPGRYNMYFKEAIDKLGVDVHLLRVGKFKSAGEPFTRRDMSPEEREESSTYLQALWRGYRTSLGAVRRLDPEAISAYANGYTAAVKQAGGDAAQVALAAKLVSGLRTGPQVEQRMVQLVGMDSERHSFNAIDFDDYVRALKTQERLHRRADSAVGVVIASGEILDGDQPSGTVGGESTAALLRQARDDNAIKACGTAHRQSRRQRARLGANLPRSAGPARRRQAGGGLDGYRSRLGWLLHRGAGSMRFCASANTVTGSIGVIAVLPTIDRTLAKIGVHVDGVGTTALSGALRVDRPMSPDIEATLQAGVDHTYSEFLEHVASGRHQTTAAIDAIAQGRVWVGSDALRLHLIDRLGNYDDAVHAPRNAPSRARTTRCG